MTIEELYQHRCQAEWHNIHELMPVLRRYAEGGLTVAEFGVDIGFSTTAFLAAQPPFLFSYDINRRNELSELLNGSERKEVDGHFTATVGKTEWMFFLNNVLADDCWYGGSDLLFIDTLHTYSQLSQELKRHGDKARQWIILHDTSTYAERGEDGTEPGLWKAVEEFLWARQTQWAIKERYHNNNGLVVLERVR